jgi:hypothetical protein
LSRLHALASRSGFKPSFVASISELRAVTFIAVLRAVRSSMPIDSLRGRPSCDFDVRLPERKTCGGQCVQSAAANSHSDENAKIVTISGLGEVPASGKREISLRVSTTYTGSAVGESGTATASTRITVTEPPVTTAEGSRTTSDATSPTIAEQFNKAVTPIYFDFDKADLEPSEHEKLSHLADWLLLLISPKGGSD